MAFKKHVPNIITLLNLSSGLIALIYAFNTDYRMAFMWVAIGIFFDFWDGFAARVLKAQSPIGLQLDSLADMVTSGVVPGLVMFQFLVEIANNRLENVEINLQQENFYIGILPYVGFIITLASAYRLAKFNVDTRQTDSFIGLPTPANSLFIMSLPLISSHSDGDGFVFEMLSNPFVLAGICLLSAFLLNSNIRLFSLKIKHFDWETHKTQVIFLVVSAVALALLQYAAIPLIILFYVVLSLFVKQPV
ncbi:phosphatidylserine synthase [Flavobacterium akiainvivens]|uniref:Phosphatidylserine synthase n=1 Tax=Flavobacterium akiainvivens TaxID=1202724 RepID=A0A0M8MD71_9FLAO|nr:CDP-alcohol phosphatidyltransferase family protein [Flavobacterium akiainvivens]KOS06354.1 phosphatidylserine synthase [Flavobacterium akiainvivens]SFQ15408.1 CDP-diacylglycerol---serine O-phosphatidyltransferase [Flavobacterium akiainvivens]